jgi:hypothetical protein
MYAYLMHIIDYFVSYWDKAANERYNKYKREQILAQNRKTHYKRKLAKLNLSSNDYKSVKEYIKNEMHCSSSEVDEILEDSVHSGIDLNIPSRWVLLSVFSRNNKIHIEEIKQKYNTIPNIPIPHNNISNENCCKIDNEDSTYLYQMDDYADYD